MSDQTPNLGLPWLMPAQAQKHVTLNESLGLLDALVHPGVESRTLTAQPVSPAEGVAYLLPANATGTDWSAFSEHTFAYFQDAAWHSFTPRVSMLAHIRDEAALAVFDGNSWVGLSSLISALSNLTELGVGTTPDASNRFAAKLNAALWTALTTSEGGNGDLRFILNKEMMSSTASMLFRTGWSGRAEFGLTGSDNFALKMSNDGSVFQETLTVTQTGLVGINNDSPVDVLHLLNAGDVRTRLIIQNDLANEFGQAQLQLRTGLTMAFLLSHGVGVDRNRWGEALAEWNEFLSWSGNGMAVGTVNAAPVIIGTNSEARIRLTSDGKIGVHTDSPTGGFDINEDTLRLRQTRTPTSASALGHAGELCWDSDYIYVCVATDSWKRAALSSW